MNSLFYLLLNYIIRKDLTFFVCLSNYEKKKSLFVDDIFILETVGKLFFMLNVCNFLLCYIVQHCTVGFPGAMELCVCVCVPQKFQRSITEHVVVLLIQHY